MLPIDEEFYIRYYIGPSTLKGLRQEEFTEFEVSAEKQTLTYRNHSGYKGKDDLEATYIISRSVIDAIKEMVIDSTIMNEDDDTFPPPDSSGKQELEIVYANEHISLNTNKQVTLLDESDIEDPIAFKIFYTLCQNLKSFLYTIIKSHPQNLNNKKKSYMY
mmetsp:Transcript_6089/g.8862  ORF Transcript_6089/g.8862 Transcript_6089/m.8862 type:complete len:161 (-) Transcript_6089:18-500(-)